MITAVLLTAWLLLAALALAACLDPQLHHRTDDHTEETQ